MKAKRRNSEEGESRNYQWKVRGTPKTGLKLKRIMNEREDNIINNNVKRL